MEVAVAARSLHLPASAKPPSQRSTSHTDWQPTTPSRAPATTTTDRPGLRQPALPKSHARRGLSSLNRSNCSRLIPRARR
eukprot:360078-Chlamydomonas_euryale.AAC.17